MPAITSDILRLVDEFLMLLKESADYQQHGDVKTVLIQAMAAVAANRRRLQTGGKRYVVAVVGLTNVGKSTLLNALLGSELAPRRNGPCTAAPIEFCYGDRLRITAYHRQKYSRPHWHCEHVEEVHQRLSLLADEDGANATRDTRKVEVQVAHPLLKSGLVIADTPGFGAVQLGDASGSHEEALKQYLHHEVSQVFWVVLADQGIGQREMQFHTKFFAQICDDVVVTGCEDWAPFLRWCLLVCGAATDPRDAQYARNDKFHDAISKKICSRRLYHCSWKILPTLESVRGAGSQTCRVPRSIRAEESESHSADLSAG